MEKTTNVGSLGKYSKWQELERLMRESGNLTEYKLKAMKYYISLLIRLQNENVENLKRIIEDEDEENKFFDVLALINFFNNEVVSVRFKPEDLSLVLKFINGEALSRAFQANSPDLYKEKVVKMYRLFYGDGGGVNVKGFFEDLVSLPHLPAFYLKDILEGFGIAVPAGLVNLIEGTDNEMKEAFLKWFQQLDFFQLEFGLGISKWYESEHMPKLMKFLTPQQFKEQLVNLRLNQFINEHKDIFGLFKGDDEKGDDEKGDDEKGDDEYYKNRQKVFEVYATTFTPEQLAQLLGISSGLIDISATPEQLAQLIDTSATPEQLAQLIDTSASTKKLLLFLLEFFQVCQEDKKGIMISLLSISGLLESMVEYISKEIPKEFEKFEVSDSNFVSIIKSVIVNMHSVIKETPELNNRLNKMDESVVKLFEQIVEDFSEV